MNYKWSKLRLLTQIVIISAFILAITITIMTIGNIERQQNNLRSDLLNVGLALGHSLSSTLSYQIVLEEFDAVEEILLKFANFPDIKSLKLVDTKSKVLSHVIKNKKGELTVSYEVTSNNLPQKIKKNQEIFHTFKHDALIIWYPLKTSVLLGWLNINISLAEIQNRRTEIINENIIKSIVIIFINIFVFLLIMLIPTRKIHHAIESAQQLDSATPQTSKESGGSKELTALFSALNDAAKRLTAQRQTINYQTDELKNNNITLTHAKENLQYSQDRFERATSGTNDGLWDCDLKNSEVWCSARFNALLGSAEKSSHIKLESFFQYFHPDERSEVKSSFILSNPDTKMLNIRCKIKNSNNQYNWFQIQGRIFNDRFNHDTDHFSGAIRDISEQIRIETMKDEFISTVSHELRTPLTSIKGSLELILGGVMGNIDKNLLPMLDVAQRNSEILLHIINDILDMSKAETGKLVYHYEELELYSLIRENIELNSGLASTHKVDLIYNSEIDEAWISSDKARLNQILNNLLSNAIKFSKIQKRKGIVNVLLSKIKDKYRITINDNGPGIAKSYQPFIFDKFTQEENSQVREVGGTGLGLAITKEMLEQLGGEISFTTISGNGTSFYIDIPILIKK